MARQTVLAVDLGAESGRVMAVHFDGAGLAVEEVQRFPNTPVLVRGTLHWDVLRLWGDIQGGISKGQTHQPISLGVDTWGVDFGLLDTQGHLLGNPVHYRDQRTDGMMDRVFAAYPREAVFAETGIQFMPINTLYQMASLVACDDPQLQAAATFLTIPDLLNYWLTGVKACEYTNATTTQMLNARTGNWARDMLAKLHIPTHILPEVIQPGTRLGAYEGITVIAPACHDTGSAVAGIPLEKGAAYISSGTWSLVGVEVESPVLSDAALAANVTNEGGIYGTHRLLKNVMGLWIIQQCRATWQAQQYTYEQIVAMAEAAPPLTSLINVNDPRFLAPGDHPAQVQAYCRETNQPVPETHGAILRCVFDSLALKYRQVLDHLAHLTGQPIRMINIVGGGSQNALLNQLTANAAGLPVQAGPVEATVLGNALVQLIAQGELASITEARQLIAQGSETRFYEPQQVAAWAAAYEQYQRMIS